MDAVLRFAKKNQEQTIARIRRFVECESPSESPRDVNRFVELLAEELRGLGKVKTFPGGAYGKHLRCEIDFSRGAGATDRKLFQERSGPILVLGHSDTVWPVGTLRSMKFRQEKGRLWGPGVFDMKGGLALFITAARALRELDIAVSRRVILQVNSDEEVGSPSSRSLTENMARKSAAVLVMEPAAGLDGKAKTARKGVGDFQVTVRGVSAHAGLDFDKGANAIVEMSRQVERIAGFSRGELGITVSPGVVRGGSRSNVVPDECSLEVDVRVPRSRDAKWIERQFASLRAFDRRCNVEVEGGINRPPLERSSGVARLFKKARDISETLGVTLDECAVGGGSDGNLTGALGVPTLDGLGAIGEGAHAAHESILINRLADRTALIARLIQEI